MSSAFVRLGIVLAAVAGITATVRGDVRPHALFSNGVVLQREALVRVFGFGTPGEEVRVTASFGAASDVAVTDADGRWRALLQTPGAGGPYTLEVRGRNVVHVEDVWLGEVWLGSGQSNMQMPVGDVAGGYGGVEDWQSVVAAAADPRLRLFDIAATTAIAPTDDVRGAWAVATPETVATWSAAAYFFARKLRAELDVPVGIVTASWGGTSAEAWTSGISLKTMPEFAARIAALEREARAPLVVERERTRALEAWLAEIEECDHGLRDGFAAAAYDDTAWTPVTVPGELGGAFADADGVIWLRRTFELPAALLNRELTLRLGPIDDFDATYIDGVRVGFTAARAESRSPRRYVIPAALATPGRHALAVRLLDVAGTAGILGGVETMSLANERFEMPLAGTWRARAGAPLAALPARPADIDFGAHTPSALYNGMIAPLTPFTLRGVIWYQGESNRPRAESYAKLFPTLIEDWRARFGRDDLPFYLVQIAPFAYVRDRGEAIELREAQRRALRLAHTGMVATGDVGDARNIHPREKRQVGERLALWALARTYGRDGEFSGPLIDEAASGPVAGTDEFELAFDHARGLRFDGEARGQFRIRSREGAFVPATARIVGEKVRLSAEGCAAPVAAELAPDPADRVTLHNAAGLPAAEFRIGEWEWITRAGAPRTSPHARGDTLTCAAPITRASAGVPIGNGRLNALVWSGDDARGSTVALELDFGETWDAARSVEPDGNWRDLAARVVAGDWEGLRIRYGPSDTSGARDAPLRARLSLPLVDTVPRAFALDTRRGSVLVSLSSGVVQAFVSATHPILMVRVEGTALPADWNPEEWLGFHVQPSDETTTVEFDLNPREMSALITGRNGNSGAVFLARVERLAGVEIALSFADGSEDSDPLVRARELAHGALEVGYSRMLGEQILVRGQRRAGASVSIGDEALQHLFEFAHYLAVSLARTGSAPLHVNRAFGGRPLVKDGAALDMYGALFRLGLLEGTSAFLDWNWAWMPRFSESARDFYGVNGAVLPALVGADGAALPAAGWPALAPTNGAATAELFARAARAVGDEAFLRQRAYPFARDVAAALLDLAPRGADGLHRLPFSLAADEFETRVLSPNSNRDLALLHAAWRAALELADATGRADEAAEWRARRSELPGFDLDAQGALTVAPGVPYDGAPRSGHHAAAIHPLGVLSMYRSADERRTVDATLDGILARGTAGWSGRDCAALAGLFARGGRPETARRFLLEFERDHTLGFGFSAETDGSFATLAGDMLFLEAVQAMLLQENDGVVRMFPATSVAWPEAAFTDLACGAGFLISARRVEGTTREVRVRATRGALLRMADPFAGRDATWNRPDLTRVGRELQIRLASGEELIGTAP